MYVPPTHTHGSWVGGGRKKEKRGKETRRRKGRARVREKICYNNHEIHMNNRLQNI